MKVLIGGMVAGALLGGMIVVGSSGGTTNSAPCEAPCVPGDESIMSKKEHGTSHTPVMENLRFGVDWSLADRICNYNRRYAEHAGYYEQETDFLDQVKGLTDDQPMDFYDPNTGKLLFTAPLNRSWKDFLEESSHHGWPSFRDDEVNWEVVRVLADGETVSVDGTHLGHNLPDKTGNRYCINLVSVAGSPIMMTEEGTEAEGADDAE